MGQAFVMNPDITVAVAAEEAGAKDHRLCAAGSWRRDRKERRGLRRRGCGKRLRANDSASSINPKSGLHFSGQLMDQHKFHCFQKAGQRFIDAVRTLRRRCAASCRLPTHLSGMGKPHRGERETQPVLAIPHAYPMGDKAKIAVVIRREHGRDISESMALRILSFLSQKHLPFMIHLLIRKITYHFSGLWTIPPAKPKYGRQGRTRQWYLSR